LRRELDSSQTADWVSSAKADQLRSQLADLQARHDEVLRHADITALELRRKLAVAQSDCSMRQPRPSSCGPV
jgi:hypothetical protein